MLERETIRLKVEASHVDGMLELPLKPRALVLFAHGSGSSRFSTRNRFVASELHGAGMGTLLMDLLTAQEERDVAMRFNIALLTERLNLAADWLRACSSTKALPIGLFGASTGAASALQLAALRQSDIAAVVARGGRPDLACARALARVRAPTLLIVGAHDASVVELNEIAYTTLVCEKRLEIIEGATHLFEEAGALEAVARLAAGWFVRHTARQRPRDTS